MSPNEAKVQELVQKVGLSGVFYGLVAELTEIQSTIERPEDDDEPDALLDWSSKLLSIVEIALPYAAAIDRVDISVSQSSSSGSSLLITTAKR
jgi:hypothetical protein